MADAESEQIQRLQRERKGPKKGSKTFPAPSQSNSSSKASLTEAFDKQLYSDGDKFAGYNTSISVADEPEDEDMEDGDGTNRLVGQYTATDAQLNEFAQGGPTEEMDLMNSKEKQAQIASRQTDYQKRQYNRKLSPTRVDEKGLERDEAGTFKDAMTERELEREEERVAKKIADKRAEGDTSAAEHKATLKDDVSDKQVKGAEQPVRKRKQRWGVTAEAADAEHVADVNDDDGAAPTPKRSKWDETTPAEPKLSRWDQVTGATPRREVKVTGLDTTAPISQSSAVQFGTDISISSRNMPLSDEDLNRILPSEGYKILDPPPGYEPVRAPTTGVSGAPAPMTLFDHQSVDPNLMGKQFQSDIPGIGDLQYFKETDMAYFGKLVEAGDENEMDVEELKQRKIMRLLLKVKNGTPPMRKTALRQITDNAKSFGPGPLFDQILPLLMEKSLEDQERHLLVKVIDRILYKLDDAVRPFVHKILVVIEPLLIDQDYFARVEGREIIANLSKAAGLAAMVSTMRPDIDHVDEYVRNTTARAFAVVASALGIPALLPFLRAVCRSKKSWQARHTGVKIVQQIPILMGCAVLPHLSGLVECIQDNLNDEQTKVRTVTSLSIAALAEASHPYGIESFDPILHSLWSGAKKQRGKGLAGYLKAVGFVIPLMDEEYATYYTGEIMTILLREFSTPDEEMKKVVLKVVSQCANTKGVTGNFLKDNVLENFCKFFWTRRMALDKRGYRQVVETTVDLGQRIGVSDVIKNVVKHLTDEQEAFRKMSMETIEKLIASLGAADIDERLEQTLMNGTLSAFQEQTVDEPVMLSGFGTVAAALDSRCAPYLPQILSTFLFRLRHKQATVRQQAADLVARTANVIKNCGEEGSLADIGQLLYEHLGEEYPEVLGSILGALRQIVTVIGINTIKPPIKDLLPRLTPILRNRHEKVQENTIDLVGRIADRGPESINPREWMRICFELLDMLKAHKKGIRRAANNTFGFIAKAIGPQDVLATLLNNLRVQERQSRVCTAVAIGIVAETCAPFTVLPALMNEYRVPELNVQNGVLKALSFLFEYIGEMAKDYVYAITPLLEDALIDRDQVHRQTAASVVQHIAIGCVGLGVEDALIHLLNLLWPNIYETSPHVIDRVILGIDGIRTAVGPGIVMNYIMPLLFHPARKVREPGWRCYNNAYVQHADSMVPYYPHVKELGCPRPELSVLI